MFPPPEIDLDDPVACADALVASVVEVRLAGARRLALVARWADLHQPAMPVPADASPVRRRTQPWAVFVGGDGTPAVSRYAVEELGCLLGVSTGSAAVVLRDVVNLVHRHPRLWEAVQTGVVEDWKARKVAQVAHAAELSLVAALKLDAAVVEPMATLPFGRAMRVVEGLVIAVDPAAHEARRQARLTARYVRTAPADSLGGLAGSSGLGGAGAASLDGMRVLIARSTTTDIVRLEAMIAHLADLLARAGDTDPLDHRRAKALALLANPAHACVLLAQLQTSGMPADAETGEVPEPAEPTAAVTGPVAGSTAASWAEPEPEPDQVAGEPSAAEQSAAEQSAALGRVLLELAGRPGLRLGGLAGLLDRLRPRTTLYLHLAPGSTVARGETHGPVGLGEVTDWLTPLGPDAIGRLTEHVTVTPVVDLNDIPAVDAYETPPRLAAAIALAQPYEVFPYGTLPSRRADLDHTDPYRHRTTSRGAPPGQTRLENLGPLSRRHHNAKTHGRFTLHQPLPGCLYWRTPTGHWYEVTNRGTRHHGRGTPALLAALEAHTTAGERHLLRLVIDTHHAA